jgi:lipopolysaccharide export system protein LptA
MEIYFTSASATPVRVSQPLPSASQQTNTAGKQVERIVALGGVQLEQPGRKATGEQLVYTAQDGRFVLTGSSSEAPHISDVTRGTVTGSSLIFNDHDDSVIVSGGQSKAITETRTAK